MEKEQIIATKKGSFRIIKQTEKYTIYEKFEKQSLTSEERLQDLAWMVYEDDWGPEEFIRQATMRGVKITEIQRVMLKLGSTELLKKSSSLGEVLIW